MLIDTHAHINFNAYKNDSDEVIKRALEKNIWMINVGSQWETSCRAVDYSQKYNKGVYASVGLHPIHLEEADIDFGESANSGFKTRKENFDFNRYLGLAKNQKVVAIGEIGLDYKTPNAISDRRLAEEIKEKQKSVFGEQIKLAKELNLPIIFHCRSAYDDLIKILEEDGNLKGVIHCFCGNLGIAQKFLTLGFYLGFNGLITFSDQYDEVIKEMPLEKILLETDCPYLAPAPYRGKRNEPLYVVGVAQKIAEIKKVSFEEVIGQTTTSALDVFGILK